MKLEFIELELEWPSDLTLIDLKDYILSKLMEYGEPLRWAITSMSTHVPKQNQIISVEAVLIINQDESKAIHTVLN